MLKKKRQIKFYCNEDQFEALQLLKVTLNRTTQDFMTEALLNLCMAEVTSLSDFAANQELWTRLSDQLYALRSRGGTVDIPSASMEPDHDSDYEHGTYPEGHPSEGKKFGFYADERDLWLRCLVELPDSTIRAFNQLMQDSLKFFSSSRLKARKLHGLD